MNFCSLCVTNVGQIFQKSQIKLHFALCVKIPQSAGEFVPVDALVIWVVLEAAVRPLAADGSPEKALSGSAAREKP